MIWPRCTLGLLLLTGAASLPAGAAQDPLVGTWHGTVAEGEETSRHEVTIVKRGRSYIAADLCYGYLSLGACRNTS